MADVIHQNDPTPAKYQFEDRNPFRMMWDIENDNSESPPRRIQVQRAK